MRTRTSGDVRCSAAVRQSGHPTRASDADVTRKTALPRRMIGRPRELAALGRVGWFYVSHPDPRPNLTVARPSLPWVVTNHPPSILLGCARPATQGSSMQNL